MHSEAIGSVWTFSNFFEIFWMFESFFSVSGRNFYKRLFSRHNIVALFVKSLHFYANGVSEKLSSAFPGWTLWLRSADRQRRRWTVVGQPADGRRRRPYRQRRRKKKHLIEAAPFGRLDQMLWTIV